MEILGRPNAAPRGKRSRRLLQMALVVSLLAVAAPASAGPWVNSANGGGVDDYAPHGTSDYKIEFDARVSADGETEGQVTWMALDGTIISSGPVYCLEVRDNRAYMHWWAVEPGPGYAGFTGSIAFEDNGQGARADSDRQSFIYGGPGQGDCVLWADFVDSGYGGAFDPFPVEWLNGNIQIR